MNRAYSLRQKEVINVLDGTRLGYVCDVEINFNDGRIEGIVLPGQRRWFGIFGKQSEYIIPWENIIRVGDDIIIVEMDERTIRKYLEY